MKYLAGYTFGWPKCQRDIAPWCLGVVVTPPYAKRLAGERLRSGDDSLVMLDNGAWPAFRRGEVLPLESQVADMKAASALLGAIAYVVVPDVVGDAQASAQLRPKALAAMELWPASKRLLVVQDGADLPSLLREVDAGRAGGVFVGGKSKTWKIDTAAEIRRLSPKIYLHVGRIAWEKDMRVCAELAVDSIDNTTFMRNYGTNARTDYTERLALHCERRNG